MEDRAEDQRMLGTYSHVTRGVRVAGSGRSGRVAPEGEVVHREGVWAREGWGERRRREVVLGRGWGLEVEKPGGQTWANARRGRGHGLRPLEAEGSGLRLEGDSGTVFRGHWASCTAQHVRSPPPSALVPPQSSHTCFSPSQVREAFAPPD